MELGLSDTLLERMAETIDHTYLLTTQYRMSDTILEFSNEQFYNGLLTSHIENKTHKLEGDDNPLVFIDTSGCGYEETFDPKTRSLFNEGEYFILREHVLQNLDL